MIKKVSLYIICLIISLSVISIKSFKIVEAQTLQNPTIAVSPGMVQTVILKSDGTVWDWGYNACGNLGDGTSSEKNVAVKVSGLKDIIAISSGGNHTIALKNDGTVWGWGANYDGQLGNKASYTSSLPVQINGLSDIKAISAGLDHNVVLKNDGTVWAIGRNDHGQLGDGTTIDRHTPMLVNGLNGVIAISTEQAHTLALKNDGTVWAWGRNDHGQLGDGTTIDRVTPVLVNGLSGTIKAISAGGNHSVALKSDGTVWSWGGNYYNQLGDGTNIDRSIPVQAYGLNNVSAISAGSQYTIALKSNGTAWSWGSNFYGVLGDGTNDMRSIPVQVVGLSDIKLISASYVDAYALKNDNTVWGWGSNGEFKLGDQSIGDKNIPTQPLFLDYLESVSLDVELVDIGYSTGDSRTSITRDIVLPSTGVNGTTITWQSSNPSIVSNQGKIIRPDYFSGDANITLTAIITKGTSRDTKDFLVTVNKNPITDAESINLDKQSIKISYADGDGPTSITHDIKLPIDGSNATTIKWSSSNPSIITNEGKVNRPSYLFGDANVTLTAIITKGTSRDTKDFLVTVNKNSITDAESINLDKQSIKISYADGDSQSNITQDIKLPMDGSNGTKINWSSSNPSIITNEGKINRPSYISGDANITLTATVVKGEVFETRSFPITIKAEESTKNTSSSVFNSKSSNETSTTKLSNELPKTGSIFNFFMLNLTGVILIFLGVVIHRIKALD